MVPLSLDLRVGLLWILFTGAASARLAAQMPLGIIEGHLVDRNLTHVALDLEGARRVSCAVDGRTFVDRERQRLSLNDLKIGDFLEIVTERHGLAKGCFARMIHIANHQRRFAGRHGVGEVARATETISPRGNVEVTGVVRDLQPGSLEVKTRQDGAIRLRLRRDTAFVRDGVGVDRSALGSSQRVSIRAGYALDGELEAYQVVWGSILRVY
jgi:hypothetical protein